jgi:hypothetical protein
MLSTAIATCREKSFNTSVFVEVEVSAADTCMVPSILLRATGEGHRGFQSGVEHRRDG